MKKYDHTKIEKKWQKRWERHELYKADDRRGNKHYLLVEFPYPSGDGLHAGHVRPYTAMDVVARKRRAEGKNVLYPIGWDAFGLPTENYAIKTGIHPREVTRNNTDKFKKQIKSLGISFDWSREINTSDPSYYKWTQWIFLQLYKKGLAYKDKISINWCLSCRIGLANEEVLDGRCERCDGDTEKRKKEQWMLAITKYADRLFDDLDTVDYTEAIKTSQRNWIGRSHGAELTFKIKGSDKEIKVFTTRPDTLFGATYMVLAPEHPLIYEMENELKNAKEIGKYIRETSKKTDMERTAEGKKKTGVELKGVKAVNPANGEEIPILISDYVLTNVGTGAIMAVPAHDERDFEFAERFGLQIREVIQGVDEESFSIKPRAYVGEGKLINSGKFDGMDSEEAKAKITEKVGGKMVTTYKLRDWVFSRQRYWGEPIPMINCKKCGWTPVPEDELPVELPDIEKFEPTETGESPLANIASWVNVKCPKCHNDAKRETDTMPNWAGSSWYFLRYTDPTNTEEFAAKKLLEEWTPVDWYNGGMEHTTLHVLYSRFWHKFLYDQGLVPSSEPYNKRTSHGLVLAEGGAKMSKSKENVVDPSQVVENVGADTLRVYEMFMGPFEQAITWSTNNMVGSRRFLERVWRVAETVDDKEDPKAINTLLHKTIKKVGDDIEAMKFNTAVSELMIFINEIEKEGRVSRSAYETFLQLLAPFAPHITEELWEHLEGGESIHKMRWPDYDESKIEEDTYRIAVQVNGKLRGEFEAEGDLTKEEALEKALKLPNIKKWTKEKKLKKFFYVPKRLINIVI